MKSNIVKMFTIEWAALEGAKYREFNTLDLQNRHYIM